MEMPSMFQNRGQAVCGFDILIGTKYSARGAKLLNSAFLP